ncbi:MAG: hypothetical protein JOZ69_15105 [Myxococcales bacterium]|nr:hypothetical protein [Myxococcales bacterium]
MRSQNALVSVGPPPSAVVVPVGGPASGSADPAPASDLAGGVPPGPELELEPAPELDVEPAPVEPELELEPGFGVEPDPASGPPPGPPPAPLPGACSPELPQATTTPVTHKNAAARARAERPLRPRAPRARGERPLGPVSGCRSFAMVLPQTEE